jgi:hypothetical protein
VRVNLGEAERNMPVELHIQAWNSGPVVVKLE